MEFKRCEALARYRHEGVIGRRNPVLSSVNYYFQRYVFDFIGKYGTAPTRVLFNVAVFIFLYGSAYFLMSRFFPSAGSVASTLPDHLNSSEEFLNCLYYSAITFFTVGYGDYFAYGTVKILAVAEGFTGVFMMSYFTVAFVRKILR